LPQLQQISSESPGLGLAPALHAEPRKDCLSHANA